LSFFKTDLRVVTSCIAFSLVVPFVSYPVADFIHGPYYHCIGRFEVYFNPTHPDPLTPGTCFKMVSVRSVAFKIVSVPFQQWLAL
jgi:hypothetical protein